VPGFPNNFDKYVFCIALASKSKFIKAVGAEPVIEIKNVKNILLYYEISISKPKKTQSGNIF
jgi:hypothetical protein